jgi:SPOR domain
MKNIFLALLLANLGVLAWQQWVDPLPANLPPGPVQPGLHLYQPGTSPAARATRPSTPIAAGNCVRVGPFASAAGAAELASSMESRGVGVSVSKENGQIWLGNWVQVGGFLTLREAETARQRLQAGGLADVYLMQDASPPVISLGVFRDRAGADRVAGVARRLGFRPAQSDRFRATTEFWIQVKPAPGQSISAENLKLPGAQILRTEAAECPSPPVAPPADSPAGPAGAAMP